MITTSKIGCFGKLRFDQLDDLQRRFGSLDSYWADAVALGGDWAGVSSIDTIALSLERLSQSVMLGIFHALNDVYAAGSQPVFFSAAVTLPKSLNVHALVEVTESIRMSSVMSKCKLGKLHTNQIESGIPTLTVCAIGSPTLTERLTSSGFVWLLDSLADVDSAILTFDLSSFPSRLAMRESIALQIRKPMKDVSGDGLAGALYQLCLRHGLAMVLDKESLLSLIKCAPLDACARDRNISDYFTRIGGMSGCNSSRMRHILFEPQLFGPIICLTDAREHPAVLDIAVKIGEFDVGKQEPRIEIA
jgi:hypothetical protein